MGVIAIPNVLREKLGDEGVDAFTAVIREIDIEARKDALAIAEERFESRLSEETNQIKSEIEKSRADFKVEIEKSRTEFKVEIEKNRTELEKNRTELEKNKAELLKWMFIFWIGQIGVIS